MKVCSHTLQSSSTEVMPSDATIHRTFIYLSISIYSYLSIYLSIYLSHSVNIYISFYRSISVCSYLSIYLSIYLCSYLTIYLSQSFKHVWLNNKSTFCRYNFIRILSSFRKSVLVVRWIYRNFSERFRSLHWPSSVVVHKSKDCSFLSF